MTVVDLVKTDSKAPKATALVRGDFPHEHDGVAVDLDRLTDGTDNTYVWKTLKNDRTAALDRYFGHRCGR